LHFCFKIPIFQVSSGKIQLSRFCFVNFLRKQKFIFRLFSSA
jgi:hypothetical protein